MYCGGGEKSECENSNFTKLEITPIRAEGLLVQIEKFNFQAELRCS